MTGEAIIAELKDLQPIEGADRIVQGTIFGETVIVSKDHKEGDVGILFDCETQLSHEFCHENNMYRHSELNKDKDQKGYIDDNRRVRPVRMKGVKCSGLWMPLSCLGYASGLNDKPVKVGQQLTEWNVHEICKKYVNPKTNSLKGNKGGKAKENLVPTFKEHIDTDQFMRNLQHVKPGCTLIVTEKLHGTSCRVANLPVIQKQPWYKKLFGIEVPAKYGHIVGSRRVTKQAGASEVEARESYYESDVWSASAEVFRGKMLKGETVYYEIVGFTSDGTRIMGSQANKKLKPFMDKKEYAEFIEKYGEATNFTYGCEPGEHKVFVYRITTTNVDGDSIDYSWDQVKMRCEQMGVEYVPELGNVKVPSIGVDMAVELVTDLTEESSMEFPQQLREGVVVRIDGPSMTPKFLKNKSYLFKVLEGIIKDSDAVDLEESQG